MNVLLNMAISPNGLIARDNGDEEWLPEEGWTEFVSEAQQLNNIVMGRETYEIVTRLYDEYNFDNVKVKYKVIITRNLTFKAPEGYIVLHSPEEAIDYIASKNIECLFLIGGGKLNAEFLKRKLVNEIELTINPYIIGKGRSFVNPTDFDLSLELLEHRLLSKGRIFIKYRCLNS